MEDEIVVDAPEAIESVEATPTPAVPPAYEAEAREQGWRPKDEWEGDPEKWRPAKEFAERGELFGKIDHMGKELKETRKALKMLQEHHTKVKETEYNRAIEELKGLQKKHLSEGDADKYLEATELLTDLKTEQKARAIVQETAPAQVDPRFTEWTAKNTWYAKETKMRDYADMVGTNYASKNPTLDPEEVLKYVTSEVKERFKDKFVNPNRAKQTVEGSSNGSSTAKPEFKMSDDERKVMNTFVRAGVMSKDDYIKELKSSRGSA
jgi:hypothetical protein